MFVPVINTAAYGRYVTVINRNIIYTDTVLSLKDLGENISVTSIKGIEEYNFEECLKTIFESNSGVVFNTIQYSRAEKKIYFYTDGPINKEVWTNKQYHFHQPITTKAEILEEVKSVLGEKESLPDDSVTALDIFEVIKDLYDRKEDVRDKYGDIIESAVKNGISSYSNVIVSNFDYKAGTLKLRFSRSNYEYKDVIFTKENGDLRIVKSESIYDMDLLECAPKALSDLYDEMLAFAPYAAAFSTKVNPVNSRFLVDIDLRYGIYLFVRDKSYNREFSIARKLSEEYEKYDVDCNSTIVMEAVKGKEREIFKRIYVRIEDCPECIRQLLYELKAKKNSKQKKFGLFDKIKKYFQE